MRNYLLKLIKSEKGAVTVDWVIITAGVVSFAAVSFFVIEDNSKALGDSAAATVAAELD